MRLRNWLRDPESGDSWVQLVVGVEWDALSGSVRLREPSDLRARR